MSCEYKSLPKKVCADNLGGIGVNFIGAPVDDFLSIKKVGDDKVTISETHTFKPGKPGWVKIGTVLGRGSLKMIKNGERGSRGNDLTVEFFREGNDKGMAKFDRQSKNQDWIVLAIESDDTVIQCGTENIPMEVVSDYDSKKQGEGGKGWTIKVNGYALGMQFYEGDITPYAPDYTESGSGSASSSSGSASGS